MYVKKHKVYYDNGNPLAWSKTSNYMIMAGKPKFLVIHHTSTPRFASTINWFGKPESKASAHFLISRTGEMTQFVPCDRAAWHAGLSRWEGLTNLNHWSIGIELSNAGKLHRSARGFVSVWGDLIPESEVKEVEGRFYQTWPQTQLQMAVWLAQALHRQYDFEAVLGHCDISPGRKTDPDPLFPMEWFRKQVLGG